MNFINSPLGNSIRKEFPKPTYPQKPFRRILMKKEHEMMHKHFPNHSWSDFVDAGGKIVLGGGEEERGSFYITEEDLKKLT